MSSGATVLSPLQARQLMRRAQGLDRLAPGVDDVLARMGYVQIDPINVCGRMHDHILRNRVEGYREGDLARHLHPQAGGLARTAFEHHHPSSHILVALPVEAWPYLRRSMRERQGTRGPWMGRLTAREKAMAGAILARLKEAGPVGPEDFERVRSARSAWGASTLAKATLQKLFFHGLLLIADRRSNRRLYDLPERVLPAPVLALAEPSSAESARWLALLKLRQHRLCPLSPAERRVLGDLASPVDVPGCPALFCLADDLHGGLAGEGEARDPLLLAPLDPLIYNRRLTRALWGFDYVWEAYTPPAKRRRGYYALPVLSGTCLVGHVDLKADWPAGRLRVVSRGLKRGHSIAAPVRRLADFLGLRN